MFMVRIASDIGFHYIAITHMIERKSYGVEANIINIFEFIIRLILLYLMTLKELLFYEMIVESFHQNT